MAKAKKSHPYFVPISDISGSKAEADRLRKLDQERQHELRQDLIDAAQKRAGNKATTIKAAPSKRVRVVGTASPLVVPPGPIHAESTKIPSLDTRGGFAGVPLPPLTEAERKAKKALSRSEVVVKMPTKKKRKKQGADNEQSTDLLDSRLMYAGSYGTGKQSRGY